MKTIDDIKNLINTNRREEALTALNILLSLGPNNISALALKGTLLAQEGRFTEEHKVWEHILSLEPENTDALDYLEQQYLEERESYFFTTTLAEGGKRFLIRPKEMIDTAIFGLLGCMAFLMVNDISLIYYLLGTKIVSTLSFLLFILIPWLYIISQFLKMPLELALTPKGITVISRTKRYFLPWHDIQHIHIAHRTEQHHFSLAVIILPKNSQRPIIEIDIARESSSLTAKSLFIKEILFYFKSVRFSQRQALAIQNKPIISI